MRQRLAAFSALAFVMAGCMDLGLGVPVSNPSDTQIATVCDAPRGKLGQMIAQVGGFTIYDSNPGTTALRPHFIQGFGDRCARQFSAALVMTGDVGTHEVVRYLPANNCGPDDVYHSLQDFRVTTHLD